MTATHNLTRGNRKTTPRFFPIFVLLLLTAASAAVQAHDPKLHGFNLTSFEPPFEPPPFELPTLAGGRDGLESHKGKLILLNFWATWCPPCLAEMPSMENIYQRYRERGFVVLAVSGDKEGAGVVAGFIDQVGVTFPVLLDPDLAVSRMYGATNLPLSLLLNREGKVIAGAQGERAWDSEEALSVLDELLSAP